MNLVYTNWNSLVSDFYRIKSTATVLYPGSPLMGTSEGGVTQHGIVNSADSVTSLGTAGSSRVLNLNIS